MKKATARKKLPTRKPRNWRLRLYVADTSATSMLALANLQIFCDQFLNSRYSLRVVDVLRDPEAAIRDNIIAIPTLLCARAGARKMLVGNLSDFAAMARVLSVSPGPDTSLPWAERASHLQEVGSA